MLPNSDIEEHFDICHCTRLTLKNAVYSFSKVNSQFRICISDFVIYLNCFSSLFCCRLYRAYDWSLTALIQVIMLFNGWFNNLKWIWYTRLMKWHSEIICMIISLYLLRTKARFEIVFCSSTKHQLICCHQELGVLNTNNFCRTENSIARDVFT